MVNFTKNSSAFNSLSETEVEVPDGLRIWQLKPLFPTNQFRLAFNRT